MGFSSKTVGEMRLNSMKTHITYRLNQKKTVEDDEGYGIFELSCNSLDTFNLVLKYAHKDHVKAWLDANFSYCAGFVPLDVLHLMLNLGASISEKRSTVLHNATRNPERLRALIELGANINSITTDFDTPLHTACERSECLYRVLSVLL